jgi:hypothetical protein
LKPGFFGETFNWHFEVKDKLINGIFSLNGASMTIGTAGFLSALVTMFVNTGQQISVKWLILSLLLFLTLILILLKVIFDLSREKSPDLPFENPIKYIADEKLFVIRRNENFLNSIIVGCYLQQDEVDRLAYLAVVHLVQDKVIQIKIHADFGLLKEIPSGGDSLKNIVVRPVVPVTALQLINTESIND